MYPVSHSYQHKWSRKLAASLLQLVVIYKCCEIYVTAYDWHLKDYMVFYTLSSTQNGFLPILMIVKKGYWIKCPLHFLLLFAWRNSFNILQYIQRDCCPQKMFHLSFLLGPNLKRKISLCSVYSVQHWIEIWLCYNHTMIVIELPYMIRILSNLPIKAKQWIENV